MNADLDGLREQAENLEACLAVFKFNIGKIPDRKDAVWLAEMMESSLNALRKHIAELEKLEYESPEKNTLFRK